MHRNHDADLADVTVKDAKTGKQTVLHTTWHHPFWNATTGQWTEAAKLKTGDELRSPDGETSQTVAAVKTQLIGQQLSFHTGAAAALLRLVN